MPRIGVFDRAFLISESAATPQHVSCLAVFELPAGADGTFVRDLASRMAAVREFAHPFDFKLRHPALKSIAPKLVVVPPDQIDLEHHFRRSALPTPGGERELGVLISRLHSRPLDMSKPLWECHLIEGLEGGRFALFVKIHHALMDGVGGMRRLTAMLSTDPSDDDVRPVWSIQVSRRGDRSVSPATGRVQRLRERAPLVRAAGSMVREAFRATDEAVAAPFNLPTTSFNGRIGQQRRVATQTLDFDRVRGVADRAGVSINDVFLGVCAGALRRYLQDSGALPGKSLIAGTPVSVRVGEGDDANNAFTMTTMKLFTGIADPLDRVRAISASSTLAKDRLRGLSKAAAEGYGVLVTLPHLLQNLVGIGGRVRPPYNVVISNVPGPLEPQYMAGASLERLSPFGVIYHGVGLMVIAVTASSRMSIGFIGDRDSLPHLQHLAVYAGEELDALETRLADAAPERRSRRAVAGQEGGVEPEGQRELHR